MKVNIRDIKIEVAPGENYRQTKGGKKILVGEPMFLMTVTITVDRFSNIQRADMVDIENIGYFICSDIDDNTMSLRNTYTSNTGVLSLDTTKPIDIEIVGTTMSEGSYRYSYQ